MDLDKRIKNNHRPLSVIDIKWAIGFIGKNGFFADAINCFENLSECQCGKLVDAKDKKIYPFECDNKQKYTFFIPEEWVKEPEKTYRPFSIEDWKFKHSIGETILYRYKGTYCYDHREVEVMYLGYVKPFDRICDEAGKGELVLGNDSLGLQNLFDNYEMWVDGEWKPFGVEVKEEK